MKNETLRTQLSKAIPHIFLSETTQREGRQAEGAHLSKYASLAHAALVNSVLGQNPKKNYMELNHPSSNEMFSQIAKEISQMGLGLKVATHVRCNPRDVKAALATGLHYINTYIPIQPHSPEESRRSINQALRDIKEITTMTQNGGVEELRISVEHASFLPLQDLQSVYGEISHTPGVARVGYAVTNGFVFPEEFIEDVEVIYQVIPQTMPLQIHVHNDTGQAATYLKDVIRLVARNGRDVVLDCSVGGLGERNGILSLGDIFSQLYLINPEALQKRFNIRHYAELYYHIKEHIGIPMSRRDPLNPYAFSHSAGPHLKGMKHNDYQAIPPGEFGFTVRLNVGNAVTGWEGLQVWANNAMHVQLPDEISKQIAVQIRHQASIHGPLSDPELCELIRPFSANGNS